MLQVYGPEQHLVFHHLFCLAAKIPIIITILDLKIHKHATKGYNMRGNVVIYVDISI